MHLMLIALLLPAGRAYEATILWSTAAICAWLRLLRLSTLSSSLGPLTLMVVRMLKDVLKLLVIEGFILAALVSELYIVFRRATEVSPDALPIQCRDLFHLHGGFGYRSFEGLFLALTSGAIEGEGYTTCLMADSSIWGMLWVFSFAFKLITGVLLLNLLIAMMAK